MYLHMYIQTYIFTSLMLIFHCCDIGIPIDTLRTELQKLKSRDVDPSSGRVFAYVYTQDTSAFSFAKEACDIFDCDSNLPEVKEAVVKEFFNAFLHENALNPMVFPSLL